MPESWEEIIARSPGHYAVDCRVLGTPVTLKHRSDTAVESASTIKLIILLALLDAAQHRQISLRKATSLNRTQVGRNGSGILQSMYFNAPFTLYNLAYLMMAVSDNVATNAIIELLTKAEINHFAAENLGLKHTKLVMDRLDFPAAYNMQVGPHLGLTTASEMSTVLERLLRGDLLNQHYTRLALRLMCDVQRSTFNRRLPNASIKRFGSKTGWIDDQHSKTAVLNECGFIETKAGKLYVFSVFSMSPLDPELPYSHDAPARIEFAQLSRALFSALQKN